MEELFPATMRSLSAAAQSLSNELSKTQRFIPTSPAVDWVEYGDRLRFLHARLMQLNTLLHIEYTFEVEGLPEDVINYTKLVQEAGKECEDLVEYLLCRDQIFGSDSYIKYEVLFLKEVLNGIMDNSDHICKLLAAA